MRKPTKPRRYTTAETLQAIARMLNTKTAFDTLARPTEVRDLARGINDDSDPKRPTVCLSTGSAQSIHRWAKALQGPVTVQMTAGWRPVDVYIRVTGRIPRGPYVDVTDSVYGVTIQPPMGKDETRQIPLDALWELASTRGLGGA